MKNKNNLQLQNNDKLLSREQFNELTFKRDKHQCVFCDNKNIVAHHIIERKLFPDGGYYLNNSASVCDKHHWDVEKTDISVKEVWAKCGIVKPALPPHFDPNNEYDKWGNVILDNGMRLPSEMFYLENVQKILKDKLYLFILE